LLSVAIARVGQQSGSQVGYERFFFLCLLLVAVISLLATWSGVGSWLMNGITLALMAVGATLDTGRAAAADSI
jgi:Flp pilus assembly protein TadB